MRRVVLRMKQGSFRRGSSQTLLLLLFIPLPTLLFQFGLLLGFNLLLIASLFLLISWGRIFCLILVILLVGGVADFTPFLNTSVHSLEISGLVLASVMSLVDLGWVIFPTFFPACISKMTRGPTGPADTSVPSYYNVNVASATKKYVRYAIEIFPEQSYHDFNVTGSTTRLTLTFTFLAPIYSLWKLTVFVIIYCQPTT